MDTQQTITAIKKALEIWSLQNLCDGAILLGFVALAVVVSRGYLEALKSRLTLRVAIEAWDSFLDLGTDVLLLLAVLIGLFVTNLDIMADIKIAVPWVPVGLALLGIGLLLRAFYGGHVPGSRPWWAAVGFLAVGCALNWFGFTFIMESPGDEYVKLPFGETLISLESMRSNMNPGLTMTTFFFTATLFALEFVWAVIAALSHTMRWIKQTRTVGQGERNQSHDS
jgi:hypothetical protein